MKMMILMEMFNVSIILFATQLEKKYINEDVTVLFLQDSSKLRLKKTSILLTSKK